jgi:uncharacterized protein YjbI with pentapeptide repeats
MDVAAELRSLIATHGRACGLDLRKANVAHANLETFSAEKVDLHSADLIGTNLRDSRWSGCRLESAHCENSNWSSATLRMCSFDNAKAENSNFDAARLEDSSAIAADFSGATFRNAHLTETSFSRSVLRGTVFDEAEGDGIDFRGADLGAASLKAVHFDEADFRGADLRGADLSGGRFQSADFRGALLEGTNFEGADYSGATFDRGEAPFDFTPPAQAAPEPAEAAALHTLNEFLALLPAAFSGAHPEETMKRVQQLIDQTTASAGYSPEQQQEVRKYFSDIARPGGFDAARLQQVLAALNSDSNEPPEELKAWLEPFMKAMQKERQS